MVNNYFSSKINCNAKCRNNPVMEAWAPAGGGGKRGHMPPPPPPPGNSKIWGPPQG